MDVNQEKALAKAEFNRQALFLDKSKYINRFYKGKCIEYGRQVYQYDTECKPSFNNTPIKLCRINYKNFDDQYAMCGIQLEFTNGYKTPFPLTDICKDYPRWEVKSIDIDPTKTIKHVLVKISFGKYIDGIKMLDKDGNYIVDVQWSSFDEPQGSDWIVQEIPEG